MDALEKQQGTSYILHQTLCIISKPSVNSNWNYRPEMLNLGQNRWLFVLCEHGTWRMTLKIDMTPLLYYVKLFTSFQSHQWIQTGFTVWKPAIWVKIGDFFGRVTSKLDGWLWKTIGHLFYTTSSIVHHIKAFGEFKLELQSGNAQFGWKSAIFCPVWPWNLIDDLEKQYGTSSMLLQALCIIDWLIVDWESLFRHFWQSTSHKNACSKMDVKQCICIEFNQNLQCNTNNVRYYRVHQHTVLLKQTSK